MVCQNPFFFFVKIFHHLSFALLQPVMTGEQMCQCCQMKQFISMNYLMVL